MKKICLLIAVLATAMVARAFDFSAVTPTGQTLYFDISSGSTVTLVAPGGSNWSGYSSPAGRLQIPATVEHDGTTYSVTAIANNALRQCSDLTAVTVPGTVKTIGYTAFYRSTSLQSVTLGEGVETIGRMAFAACTALDTIELPSTLQQIGVSAFNSTAYVANSANWTGSVLYIAQYVVEVSSVVDSMVTVAEGTLGLGNGSFYYCHYLPKVELPSTLRFIGDLAFQDCEMLDTVVIRATVPPTLASDAFSGVPSVTIVVPCGSANVYRSAQYWNSLNIVEDSCPVAVATVEEEALSVAVVQGGVVVSGAQGKCLQVCDMMGRTVASTANASESHMVALPCKGIFLVTVDGISRKVAYLK